MSWMWLKDEGETRPRSEWELRVCVSVLIKLTYTAPLHLLARIAIGNDAMGSLSEVLDWDVPHV